MIGSLRTLCVHSTDPDGLAAASKKWFTVENSEIVDVDEILEEQQLKQVDQTEMTLDEEQQYNEDISDGDPPVGECDTDDEEGDEEL